MRPEHLRPANAAGADGAARARLSVTIDLVQPTGTRIYAAFRLGDEEVTAELQAHDVERPGVELDLLVDMQRAILIDPDTDRVI